MNKIKKWIADILKESGGDAVCVARVLAVFTVVAFVAYAVYGLLHGDHFDLSNFGTGLMTVLLGGASVITGKNLSQK
jgi:hypothetical protein